MLQVVETLRQMCGQRERCAYCVDSHACDIEHFEPKSLYPQSMFSWPNLLFCCTECGRFKGNQFPVQAGKPQLIDPTNEDPWAHLDFDPDTGNIVARFEVTSGTWSAKGRVTVSVLQLDRREAMSIGYRRTARRIRTLVSDAVRNVAAAHPDILFQELTEADEHGLLHWFFSDRGKTLEPMATLWASYPAVWRFCEQRLANPWVD